MPKNLLFVLDSLAIGGAEQSVVNIVPELIRRGHRCFVAALSPPVQLAQDLKDRRVDVSVFTDRVAVDASHIPRLVSKLTAFIRSRSIDVVQAYSFWSPIVVSLTKAFAPRPIRILSLHSLDLHRYPPKSRLKKASRAGRLGLLRWGFDRRFAVSQAVFDSYNQHVPGFATDVCYNAIAESAFSFPGLRQGERADFRKRLGLHNENDYLIVNVGRLIAQKGQQDLIEALSQLTTKGLDARLVFCGSGPLEQDLQAQACRLGIEERVLFLGHVPHPELFSWIVAADVFALPSLTEGLCIALAEAMVLGTPVVATRVGGNPEMIAHGETGLLVEPGQPTALAHALLSLLSDAEKRREFAEKGRCRAEAQFRPERIVENWEAMYGLPALRNSLVAVND